MGINLSRRDEDDETSLLAEINVTPLVDVMLVLLIIFMVTAPLMMAGVQLRLPKTPAARVAQPHQPIVLSLNQAGHVFLDREEIPKDVLPARLIALAQGTPDRIVYVRADRTLPYGQVMQIIGVVATAGFSRISLLAEKATPPSRPDQ